MAASDSTLIPRLTLLPTQADTVDANVEWVERVGALGEVTLDVSAFVTSLASASTSDAAAAAHGKRWLEATRAMCRVQGVTCESTALDLLDAGFAKVIVSPSPSSPLWQLLESDIDQGVDCPIPPTRLVIHLRVLVDAAATATATPLHVSYPTATSPTRTVPLSDFSARFARYSHEFIFDFVLVASASCGDARLIVPATILQSIVEWAPTAQHRRVICTNDATPELVARLQALGVATQVHVLDDTRVHVALVQLESAVATVAAASASAKVSAATSSERAHHTISRALAEPLLRTSYPDVLEALQLMTRVDDGSSSTTDNSMSNSSSNTDDWRLGHLARSSAAHTPTHFGAWLGCALSRLTRCDRADHLLTTVVADAHGVALGLVYSSTLSLAVALARGRGVYWSRSRASLWEKGLTSGASQVLLGVALDCDADALRFTVHQVGAGFCHLERYTCWPDAHREGIYGLMRTLVDRRDHPVSKSYTNRLLNDHGLLNNKIVEEAHELVAATSREEVASEAADVLYFTSVALCRANVSWSEVEKCLDLRSLRLRRRAGNAKPTLPAATATSSASAAVISSSSTAVSMTPATWVDAQGNLHQINAPSTAAQGSEQ